MSIFSAPTDSFYKFLAVGGLIIFIAAFVLLKQTEDFQNNLIINQWEEEQLLQKEIELLSFELDNSQKYQPIIDSLKNYFGVVSLEEIQLNDSIAKKIIFNLPDVIQEEFKEFLYKKRKLKIKKDSIDYKTSDYTIYIIIFVPLIFGELCALIGFFSWYEKIQKPINKKQISEDTQRFLEGEIWFENCQSCCKTFFYKYELGIEKDGSINKLFCKDCYVNGAFVEPELTYKEARKKLELKLKEKKYWFIHRIGVYRKFKKLYRWDRNRIW